MVAGMSTGEGSSADAAAAIQTIAYLQKYSKSLYEGLAAEKAYTDQVNEAIPAILAGLGQIEGGITQMYDKTSEIDTAAISKQMDDLTKAVGQLYAGAQQVDKNLSGPIITGAGELAAGTGSLAGGVSDLQKGEEKLKAGSSALSSGAADLNKGAGELAGGTNELAGGTKELNDGAGKLAGGASDLKDGAGKLYNGTEQLADGAYTLTGGAKELDEGTGELLDGAKELDDGAHELNDGMGELLDGVIRMNDEGISKITQLFSEDLGGVKERFEGIRDAGRSYRSFSGSGEGENDSVKFIYRTDAIKAE